MHQNKPLPRSRLSIDLPSETESNDSSYVPPSHESDESDNDESDNDDDWDLTNVEASPSELLPLSPGDFASAVSSARVCFSIFLFLSLWQSFLIWHLVSRARG